MAQSQRDAGVVTVCLLHEGQKPRLTYPARLLSDDGDEIVVRAPWAEAADRDVGYVRFEQGDVWTEHYWRTQWYAVKEIRDHEGRRKGWYCDVTRPATLEGDRLLSEDLYLDLWVAADGETVLRLDEDEFEQSGLSTRDPETAEAAWHALDELEALAREGFRAIASGD